MVSWALLLILNSGDSDIEPLVRINGLYQLILPCLKAIQREVCGPELIHDERRIEIQSKLFRKL